MAVRVLFCIRHTVRKKVQMQRSGDRVRIAPAQDKQRRLELCLRLVLACHQIKTDHARNADRIQQKRRK
nr:MAG TPA: hypothetical protein [Bacteriophage sp.]